MADRASGAQTRTPRCALLHALAERGLDWIVPDWAAPPCVGALFTTRNGEAQVHGDFDVGPARLERLEALARMAIERNRAKLRAFLPAPPHFLEQVHGREVALVTADTSVSTAPVADAVVTREANVVLGVRVADCLPVLLASRAGTVVAAAHAGWRGLAAGVIEATIERMRADATGLVAWIGPGIGADAFEVGRDVLDAFCERHGDDARFFVAQPNGKWLADLPGLARARLERAGVTSVASESPCTLRGSARFHSYRRDRSNGRMAALVWRAAPC